MDEVLEEKLESIEQRLKTVIALQGLTFVLLKALHNGDLKTARQVDKRVLQLIEPFRPKAKRKTNG